MNTIPHKTVVQSDLVSSTPFTGKERDRETGYSYFGARYYDSDLSGLFLSVDPMADKYPSLSPYAYCAWNPVKLVDPDGCDEWEINQQGRVVNRIETNKHDAFFIVDENGNRMMDDNYIIKYKSIKFEYGTVSEFPQNKYFLPPSGFEIKNNSSGSELFKFLADNTTVEFGLVTTKETGSYVMTNHKENAVDATGFAMNLDKKGTTIISISHNHPQGCPPSGFNSNDTHGDRYSAQRLFSSNGNRVNYFVYSKQTQQFTMYDGEKIYNNFNFSAFLSCHRPFL
ncbi:MAG: hypothetical protein K6D59_03215 [Bacteroidales bacterium]|nr:hypothetical protein [Bacteroidales bacterium]